MKFVKSNGIILSFFLIVVAIAPAHANTTLKTNKLVNAFNKYFSDNQNEINAKIVSLDSQYTSQLSDSNIKLQQSINNYRNFNKIKVLKLGENRNYWGSFNCPTERPDCIGVDKGPIFKVGEITTIKDVVPQNVALIEEIELIKNLGLIEIIDSANYQKYAEEIKNLNKGITLLKFNYSLNSEKLKKQLSDLLDYEFAIKSAVSAAKRARLNSSIYEKAFVEAFKFKYNQYGLDRLARAPWSSITNLKSLDSAVEITRLSQRADLVDSKYSYKSAVSINKLCGQIFLSEPEFQKDLILISQIYLRTTGTGF